MLSQSTEIPRWLKILVRCDFVTAVVLTVLVPLWLLARALRQGRTAEMTALLRYWRASALLMVTVYLLADERRVAFAAGCGARAAIAATLTPVLKADATYERWRTVTRAYCVAGAAANVPLVAGSFASELPVINRAYIEPTQEFAAVLHPNVDHKTLGRVGVVGLMTWLTGVAVKLAIKRG